MRNVSGVWLGATMGCCECHNHKFDPYSQRDFYRMAAFFADVKDNAVGRHAVVGEIPVPTPQQQEQLDPLEKEIAILQARLDVTTPELEAAQDLWEKQARRAIEWTPLEPGSVTSANKSILAILPDHSILAGGPRPDRDTYTITAPLPAKAITAIQPRGSAGHQPSRRRTGSVGQWQFPLFSPGISADNGSPIDLKNASADFEQDQQLIADSINAANKSPRGWAIQPQFNKPHTAIVETAKDVAGPGTITIRLDQLFEPIGGHLIGRFRLSVTDAARPVAAPKLTPQIEKFIQIPREKRNNAQRGAVLAYYRTIAPVLDGVRGELAKKQEERNTILASTRKCEVTVQEETPRTTRILARGNWQDETGEIVTPAVPHFLAQPAANDRRLTRLDLAKWIVDPQNPLTARVFVNRLSGAMAPFYGVGISKSVDDFGVQGEKPTNLELLDYLASEFIASHWDIKHVIRLMVTSNTYRQSSAGSKELRDRDPYNRIVARQSPIRIDAEFVRDNAV